MIDKPVKRFRLGFIKAAIWENENKNGNTFYNVKLNRTYKDGDEYRSTDNLTPGDLQNAREVLQKASEWIISKT